MDKIDIKSLSKRELEGLLAGLGGERYRSGQVCRWLYGRGARSFDEMTDLNARLREKLKAKCRITHVSLLDSKRSHADGTTKYLFKLEDSSSIETVFIPEKSRNTICLSSQVGCKFGCLFCASAPFGFVRNLKVSEMLDEVLFVKAHNPGSRISNIVFMGIGEPFDNYDNVMNAIRALNDKDGFDIGARKITVSTCGIIPAMERFAKEGLQVELSVSLHSADNATRSKIVPVNKKYPLSDLLEACREYVEATNRIITFEYVLIDGVNASEEDAHKLAKLLKGMKCKVNVIAYNQIKAGDYSAPSVEKTALFMRALKGRRIKAMLRKSRGEDIDAGCGQLRISKL
ncbi:MAG: 23S rRNA (adenine(2503)-C(2))-methyltransferase RlmN [Candidatus Omnitrophica bacterium]|nr:23S rRNA (adenine(2503)-C(2))-methyltransferase RlmN [Candidatus Omnitrophota bacterium]